MKRLLNKTALTVGLSALLGSLTLLTAQTSPLLNADIPFAFHAQGRVMPAGTYSLSANGGQGIFVLMNPAEKLSEFVSAPIPRDYMPKSSKLTFEKHGNEYILSEISVAGMSNTFAVPPSAIEKSLTRKLGLASMISVPLRSR